MIGGYNSALPYTEAGAKDLQQSLGTPQFSGATSENWDLVFNGMIIQGGKITIPATSPTTFQFSVPFTQQVLGVFVQRASVLSAGAEAANLAEFTITSPGAAGNAYWWAIGV
jgi:hypothetical protein